MLSKDGYSQNPLSFRNVRLPFFFTKPVMWCSQVLCFCGTSVPQCRMSLLKVTCVLLFTLKQLLLSVDLWLFPCIVLGSSPLFQTFTKHLTRYQNGNNLFRWRPYFQRNGLGFRYFDCNIVSLIGFMIKSPPAHFAITHWNVSQQKRRGYLYSTW